MVEGVRLEQGMCQGSTVAVGRGCKQVAGVLPAEVTVQRECTWAAGKGCTLEGEGVAVAGVFE